jgi:hypothetical protein
MEQAWLVECFWPGVTPQAYAEAVGRAATAARALQADGRHVRLLDSLLVPADEFAFYRFTSPSVANVERACAQAGLPFERILECLTEPAVPTGWGGPDTGT